MDGEFIASTPDDAVKWIGDSYDRNPDVIRGILKETLGQAYADLFAEPVFSKSHVIDWYAQTEGKPFRVAELPADEQTEAVLKIKTLLEDIGSLSRELQASDKETERRKGKALQVALNVPDDSRFWIVKNQRSKSNTPIIIEWGSVHEGMKAGGGTLSRQVTGPNIVFAASGPIVQPAARLGWLFWLLWAIIIALFFFNLALMIAPCELTGGRFLARCPAVVDTTHLSQQNRQIENQIAQMEREVALLGATCQSSAPAETIQ